MPFIVWTCRYETEVVEIDNQHKKLVDLINRLFDSISASDKQATLNQIFTELVNYTVYHFKFEEDLMQKHGYKDFKKHKEAHSLFVEKVNFYAGKFNVSDNKMLLELINFLREWLLNHILLADKEMVRTINGK